MVAVQRSIWFVSYHSVIALSDAIWMNDATLWLKSIKFFAYTGRAKSFDVLFPLLVLSALPGVHFFFTPIRAKAILSTRQGSYFAKLDYKQCCKQCR